MSFLALGEWGGQAHLLLLLLLPRLPAGIYCLAEILEFAAFIHLRVSRPDLERPYR